jgi:alpha-glucosidase (family GH31 glycosyl hydrolase)
LGKTNPEEWYYRVSGGIFSYFFVQGENLEDLQKYYYDLTGYPPIPPKWAFGLLQSKCAYESDTMVYRIVNEFNKRNMPIDAIILDAYWFGGYKQEYPKTMGNFTWLKMNFPDHRQYLDSLHGMGIKTILINEPYINTDSENWDLLEKEGWLVPQEGKDEPYIWSPSWCGDNALFDATNPEAREWLWGKFRDFISEGVDGLWIDLTEPERAVPNGLYHLGPNDKIHNIYNNIWSEMLWEGYEKDFPGQRIFNLTRGGYAGVQRYGAINWSGDASKTWVSFKMQVPMLIGCTMSGMPHYSSDIGGFTNAWDRIDGLTLFTNFDGEKILTTPELYTRWFQFGVFSPLLRPHSGEEQYCEPFSHGPEAEKITTRYLKWRYRLVPFLYSYAYKTSSTGELLIKPVFKKDGNIANYEYRYGNEFFVAPVLEESQANRSFYLPELENDAKWVDFWTGESFESGKELTLVVDIENIPVFVRQGAIIPLAKDKKYTMESPDDTLTLRIYPGAGGEFELYEDDGLSTAWKKGEFATTNITSKQEDDKFSIQIAPIVGSYDGMIENRVWKFDVQTIKDFKSVSVNGQNVEGRKSNNNLEIIVVSETKKQVAVVIEGIVLK